MINILMVGNSYLYRGIGGGRTDDPNGPIGVFERMADAAGKDVNVTGSYIGSSSLSEHWNDRRGIIPRDELATGDYDIMVLAGQTNSPDLREFGGRFSDLARQNGTSTVFYGVWVPDFLVTPNQDSFTSVTNQIYRRAANDNDAAYSPNALAYKAAYDEYYQRLGPDGTGQRVEDFLTFDGIHASPETALLIASVLYATIFDERAPSFRPSGVSAEDARILQDIAWDTAQRQAITLDDAGNAPAPTPTDDTIRGTNGSDYLPGTNRDDEINGNGGRDDLIGFGGRDVIDGGGGADRLFGGAGADVFIFDRADTLYSGGSGSDRLEFSGTSILDMRLVDVEVFDLANNQPGDRLILQSDDVRQADGDLIIYADAGDRVTLDTNQDVVQMGSRTIGNNRYDRYEIGGSDELVFLVDTDATFDFG